MSTSPSPSITDDQFMVAQFGVEDDARESALAKSLSTRCQLVPRCAPSNGLEPRWLVVAEVPHGSHFSAQRNRDQAQMGKRVVAVSGFAKRAPVRAFTPSKSRFRFSEVDVAVGFSSGCTAASLSFGY